ncbi:13024_t:CDS:2 [Gigaspora margarita]|uniref:13024_t:CDS:1 n=1 Tax=Gigaspora margarita TaxID=4874 RepID=A0ABN7VX45_GIGMA|nr:13024_t:CDS:2 [Gigaspora margarita]
MERPSKYADTALKAIEDVSDELRDLSIKIHENPELAYEERYAHNLLVNYLQEKGFKVTPHAFGLETAFVAEFQSKAGKGRVISFNSEYDALPEIGHACGHNLIAISGVGAAIGLKAVLEKFNIKGTVKLFGTPAEGSGKIKLIDAGAYNGVDVSLMVHPGPVNGGFIPFLAIQPVYVEYFGKAAHASVIPEYTSGTFYIRGITMKDLKALQPRVHKCFEAAAEATGTTAKITWGKEVYDVKINEPLASRYEYYLSKKFGRTFLPKVIQSTISSGSTDQGNVTYIVPGFHPIYDIRASTPASNHQREFTAECKSKNAHEETIKATSGMTLVGLDFLLDDEFAKQVKNSFIKSKL